MKSQWARATTVQLHSVVALSIWSVAACGCGGNDGSSGDNVNERSQSPVIQFDEDDPKMMAAIAEARSSVDQFINALTNPTPMQTSFSVKCAVHDGGEVEHMWLFPVRYEKGKFIGQINNEPQLVGTIELGDEFEVAKDEISDWMYIDEQTIVGGFTVRVLRDEMKSPPAAEAPKIVGEHELLGKWSVVSLDSGSGPDAKDGFFIDVSDTQFTFIAPNGAARPMGKIHRIDSTTTPKELDLRNGSAVGLGIYELNGESLKFIIRDPGRERPRDLRGSSNGILFTLQRD